MEIAQNMQGVDEAESESVRPEIDLNVAAEEQVERQINVDEEIAVEAQFESEVEQDNDELAKGYVRAQQWIKWRSGSLDNIVSYLDYMQPEEEFALQWLGVSKLPTTELQELADEVFATKRSAKEAEKGNGKAITNEEPTAGAREVEREFRRATKYAARRSRAQEAMRGTGQSSGATNVEERPILMIQAAPASASEPNAVSARDSVEVSARGPMEQPEQNAQSGDPWSESETPPANSLPPPPQSTQDAQSRAAKELFMKEIRLMMVQQEEVMRSAETKMNLVRSASLEAARSADTIKNQQAELLDSLSRLKNAFRSAENARDTLAGEIKAHGTQMMQRFGVFDGRLNELAALITRQLNTIRDGLHSLHSKMDEAKREEEERQRKRRKAQVEEQKKKIKQFLTKHRRHQRRH